MADIRFHPEAQAEYRVAVAWYQARSLQAAARFEAEMEQVLERIEANPEMFPRYDEENRFAVLRRYPYSVVYQEHAGQIFVIAVAHASRSAGYWQGRTSP